MHTETQDGKSLDDAHFCYCHVARISKIVAQGVDVTTPTSLVFSFQAEGDMASSMADLVVLNRTHPDMVNWQNLRQNDHVGLHWVGRNNEYS